ncbi:MAG: ATP-binding protein [Candidatus Omnitrophota bacterium]|nr:ATP-binding protein [Candidatus Omnitrophota bacterium]
MKIISLLMAQIMLISGLVYGETGAGMGCLRVPMRFGEGKISLTQEKIERMGIAIRSCYHSSALLDIKESAGAAAVIIDTLMGAIHLGEQVESCRNNLYAQIEEFRKIEKSVILPSKQGLLKIGVVEKNIGELENMLNQLQETYRDIIRITRGYRMSQEPKKNIERFLRLALWNLHRTIKRLQSRIEIATGIMSQDGYSIASIVDDMRRIRPRIRINNQIGESAQIIGNRLSIISALYNIIHNATQHAKNVEVVLSQEGNRVKIEVIDDGEGIKPELMVYNPETGRLHLYDMNVSDTEGGTGLGLTEAWYAIKDAGGEIKVDSLRKENLDRMFGDPSKPRNRKFFREYYPGIEKYITYLIDKMDKASISNDSVFLGELAKEITQFEKENTMIREMKQLLHNKEYKSDENAVLLILDRLPNLAAGVWGICTTKAECLNEGNVTESEEMNRDLEEKKKRAMNILEMFKRLANGQRIEAGTTFTVYLPIASERLDIKRPAVEASAAL